MKNLNPYHAQMITRLYRGLVGLRGTYEVACDFINSDEEGKVNFYAKNVLPKLSMKGFPETHTMEAAEVIEEVRQEIIHNKI